MSATISLAETPEDILRCYPVMAQLRPHLAESEFVERITRQQSQGYQLAFLQSGEEVPVVAGYRMLENLAWGRFCYVDDLVTAEGSRSTGMGQTMFTWLLEAAREAGCEQLHLDSGVQRFDAHRFYLTQRMAITSHHFGLTLKV
jgi:GNAT superfamily N-acetyltransferase